MIKRIEALYYRSLRYIKQPVENFQVLVGPNSSGKSSFLDVVTFLGDMLRVGPTKAILGDSRAGVTQRAPDPTHLVWMREGNRFELAIEFGIPEDRAKILTQQNKPEDLPVGGYSICRYEVAIGIKEHGDVELIDERMSLHGEQKLEPSQHELFPSPPRPPKSIIAPTRKSHDSRRKTIVRKVSSSGNDNYYSEIPGWNLTFRLGPTNSALANLPDDEMKFPVATWIKHTLMEGVQRIALSSDAMRRPSPPSAPKTLLPDGSNLPWVVANLEKENPKAFRSWIEHLRTALPDLKTIRIVKRPEDLHSYLVLVNNNGLEVPSWVISDGTLRLLALTLLAYVPGLQGVVLIEEPENGIHPRAIETVYQSLSSVYSAQILCATHSPLIVALTKAESLLCFARDDAGATDIVRGSDHPGIRKWKGEIDLGTYFASGVLG